MSTLEQLENEVGHLDPKKNGKPAVKQFTERVTQPSIWDLCNAVPIRAVFDWLEIEYDDDLVTCPGCGEGGSTSDVKIIGNGYKCMHDRCASKGLNGFRNVVNLVAEVKGCRPIEAAKLINEHFGLGLTFTGQKQEFLVEEIDEIFAPLPPVNWLVKALEICPGAYALFAGQGSTGKSLTAQAMAVSIASGQAVWGAFPARQGRVVHIDYEQGGNLTKRRYQRLAAGMGVSVEALRANLAVVCLPKLYLDSQAGKQALIRLVDGAVLCIVDSLRAAYPSLDENSSQARIPLDELGRISEDKGCAFFMIHHAKKQQPGRWTSIRNSIRGSGAIYDAAASVMVSEGEPEDEAHTLHLVKARTAGTRLEPLSVKIKDLPKSSFDTPPGLLVTCDKAPSQAERTRAKRLRRTEALKQEVTELFQSDPIQKGGAKAIATKLGRNQQDILDTLNLMVSQDIVKPLKEKGVYVFEPGLNH